MSKKEEMLRMVEHSDVKTVFVAWVNTDRTEGRGRSVPLCVCDSEVTAERLGKGQCVQGSNAAITTELAFLAGGKWYAPTKITPPTKEDRNEDCRREEKREAQEQKAEAIERAKAAGLSEDDIAALSK